MPFSGVVGYGGLSTPKPSFPDFVDFDPCTGQMDSQILFSEERVLGWGFGCPTASSEAGLRAEKKT